MRLLTSSAPLAWGVIGAGLDELRWPRPVKAGDRLRVESQVLEVRPSQSKPDRGLAKMRSTTFNQNDEPVQIMVANLLVPRRPATQGAS
jgi:acyl dehydratase